jgi:hypothetical protein
MADAIGAVSAPLAAQYSVAVASKQQAQTSQEGKQAEQLIEAATAPKLAPSGDVGTKLNFMA